MKHLYVTLIVPAAVAIPLVAGLYNKVYSNKPLRIIFFYLLFSGISDLVARTLGVRGINNLPLLHIYTLIEFLIMMAYFHNGLKLAGSPQFTIITVLFTLLTILNFVFIQDIYHYNSYPRSIAALVIICYSIQFFIKKSQLPQRSWRTEPANWVVGGIMVYFCNSFLYFAFLNVINELASLSIYFFLGGLHATFVLLMYLLISIGFLVYKHER